jgi:hypothetical protein
MRCFATWAPTTRPFVRCLVTLLPLQPTADPCQGPLGPCFPSSPKVLGCDRGVGGGGGAPSVVACQGR